MKIRVLAQVIFRYVFVEMSQREKSLRENRYFQAQRSWKRTVGRKVQNFGFLNEVKDRGVYNINKRE